MGCCLLKQDMEYTQRAQLDVLTANTERRKNKIKNYFKESVLLNAEIENKINGNNKDKDHITYDQFHKEIEDNFTQNNIFQSNDYLSTGIGIGIKEKSNPVPTNSSTLSNSFALNNLIRYSKKTPTGYSGDWINEKLLIQERESYIREKMNPNNNISSFVSVNTVNIINEINEGNEGNIDLHRLNALNELKIDKLNNVYIKENCEKFQILSSVSVTASSSDRMGNINSITRTGTIKTVIENELDIHKSESGLFTKSYNRKQEKEIPKSSLSSVSTLLLEVNKERKVKAAKTPDRKEGLKNSDSKDELTAVTKKRLKEVKESGKKTLLHNSSCASIKSLKSIKSKKSKCTTIQTKKSKKRLMEGVLNSKKPTPFKNSNHKKNSTTISTYSYVFDDVNDKIKSSQLNTSINRCNIISNASNDGDMTTYHTQKDANKFKNYRNFNKPLKGRNSIIAKTNKENNNK